MSNIVYIGLSIDGYISDRDGGLNWLQSVPNPENDDLGYQEFITRIDAIVMGRNTFEKVAGFDGEWPYDKKVFVLSRTLKSLPKGLGNRVELIKGTPVEITNRLGRLGYKNLYIDGGKTIQSFLKNDLIDEMILTHLPLLLGGGTPLFGSLSGNLKFEHISTDILLNQMVSTRYKRKR